MFKRLFATAAALVVALTVGSTASPATAAGNHTVTFVNRTGQPGNQTMYQCASCTGFTITFNRV